MNKFWEVVEEPGPWHDLQAVESQTVEHDLGTEQQQFMWTREVVICS